MALHQVYTPDKIVSSSFAAGLLEGPLNVVSSQPWGAAQAYAQLLALGAPPAHASMGWVANHYRWVGASTWHLCAKRGALSSCSKAHSNLADMSTEF